MPSHPVYEVEAANAWVLALDAENLKKHEMKYECHAIENQSVQHSLSQRALRKLQTAL